MSTEYQKVMFEIYREESYNRRFRVVYFSELGDHNKDTEITHALDGQHYFDGYLKESTKKDAKAVIAGVLDRLNDGEDVPPDALAVELAPYLAE